MGPIGFNAFLGQERGGSFSFSWSGVGFGEEDEVVVEEDPAYTRPFLALFSNRSVEEALCVPAGAAEVARIGVGGLRVVGESGRVRNSRESGGSRRSDVEGVVDGR